jgi:hypothetical protein
VTLMRFTRLQATPEMHVAADEWLDRWLLYGMVWLRNAVARRAGRFVSSPLSSADASHMLGADGENPEQARARLAPPPPEEMVAEIARKLACTDVGEYDEVSLSYAACRSACPPKRPMRHRVAYQPLQTTWLPSRRRVIRIELTVWVRTCRRRHEGLSSRHSPRRHKFQGSGWSDSKWSDCCAREWSKWLVSSATCARQPSDRHVVVLRKGGAV